MAVVWMREWSSFSVEKPRKSGIGAHTLVQRQPGLPEMRLISVSKQPGPWDTFASVQPGPNKYTTNQTSTSCISSSRLPCMQETNHANSVYASMESMETYYGFCTRLNVTLACIPYFLSFL
jgi:hypothetical protein